MTPYLGRRRAFTLVELLIVIAVIGILAALLLPVLAQGRARGERALCTNNLRQWGIGLKTFGGDNADYFPDNRDGAHVSWCGTNVQEFWASYLIPLKKSAEEKPNYNTLFCPSQRWHREPGPQTATMFDPQIVIGYFYLPYRDPMFSMNAGWGYDYDVSGVRGWVEKRKFDGPFDQAPIAMDMKQAMGSAPPPGTNVTVSSWTLGGIPTSSHIQRGGEPYGGNFLFEDGRVCWYKSSKIGVGVTGQGWLFSYKILIE